MSVFGKVADWRLLVTGALFAAAPAFGAVMLNPGDTVYNTDASVSDTPKYTIGAVPAPWGPTAMSSGSVSIDIGAGFDGEVNWKIYKSSVDGTLAFSYEINTMAPTGGESNPVAITDANMSGVSWTGITISDVGADPAGGLSGALDSAPEWTDGMPYNIGRTLPVGANPQTSPRWTFQTTSFIGTTIGNSNTSAEVWFVTDAKDWTEAYIAVLGQGSVGRALVPVPLVPEPTTMVLMGLASGGLAMIRRRRHA